jgi:AraC-like DNA-binding protein
MNILGQTSIQLILFFILYGITGVVPLIAALYLLLRRGNAFAPDVTPPMRLRRWTAAFFAFASLTHVWWLQFYIFSGNLYSVGYLIIVMLDCIVLFTTFSGMLLAMLQDRRRPVWPAMVGLIPFVALGVMFMVRPNDLLIDIAGTYLLVLSLLFAGYMVVAIRQYGRWLNDNYADLENKKVWLSQTVALISMLLFALYVLATDMILIWLVHVVVLVLIALLLWRVETLPELDQTLQTHPQPLPMREGSEYPQGCNSADELSSPLPYGEGQGEGLLVGIEGLQSLERLLAERCVAPQLYLQHDLSLQQLAQAVGTNRSYLSQYFSRQGITYNTYINNLRINHFIERYQELSAARQPIIAQQLAQESGFRSYRTFSRAFMQRTGQSVTAWMH